MKRTYPLLFLVIALGLSGALYTGCSKGFSGNSTDNSQPSVRFVNVPPDSSTFSRNPIINWVGTDVDGRIVEFRFVVAKVSDVPVGMTPEEYALTIPFADWEVREVTLDDPANRATVPLAADSADPVNVILQQYVFLVAVDDIGAISSVVYRTFGRNNHFPDTRVIPPTPIGLVSGFVNVEKQQFGEGGIAVEWSGSDRLDFPGLEEGVPLEFEWKLFGPYTVAESTLVMDSFVVPLFLATDRTYSIGETLVDTAFDFTAPPDTTDTVIVAIRPDSLGNTFDTTYVLTPHVDSVAVIIVDTTAAQRALLKSFGVFDSVLDMPRLIALDSILADSTQRPFVSRLVESSLDPVTGNPWTTDRDTTFFDLFRNDPLIDPVVQPLLDDDSTRQNSFLFWARARDDAFVADPTPFFAFFPVIEAKHERDLLVISFDHSGLAFNVQGLSAPCVRNKIVRDEGVFGPLKATYARYIDGWMNGMVGSSKNDGFDTLLFALGGSDSLLLPPDLRPSWFRKVIMGASPDFLTWSSSIRIAPGATVGPTLRDILKHKVVIYQKDRMQIALPVKGEGDVATQWIVQGTLTGVNFWTMARPSFIPNGFDKIVPQLYGVGPTQVPKTYGRLFGIRGGYFQAWYGMAVARISDTASPLGRLPVFRNEDFVGAVPSELVSESEFPTLSVGFNELRNNLRWADSLDCNLEDKVQYAFVDSVAALPEVDFIVPITSAGTETLYLYKSRFGENVYPFWPLPFGDFQATVVAVRLDQGFTRTSHWSFTPSAMEPASFQIAFSSMMDWLFARPWGGPSFGKAAQPIGEPGGKYASLYIELSQQVKRNREQMMNEAFGGKRFFKNQFEYEEQLKSYNEMKRAESAAEIQSY